MEVACAALGHKLVPLIRVKDRRFETGCQGLLEGGEYQLTVVVFADAVGDDLAGSNIFNAGQIPDCSLIDQTADITAPDLMRLGDGVEVFEQIAIGMGMSRTGAVGLGSSPRRTQLEGCHHALGAFVIDAQMPGYPTMSISRMLTVDSFDLTFECPIFGGLSPLSIDVLPLHPQRFSIDRFMLGTAYYFDFF